MLPLPHRPVLNPAPMPNVRKLIVPDKGRLILEADLSQADAQVVAWDSGDEALKEIFKQGLSLHYENATEMYGKRPPNDKHEDYKHAKAGVHATNYGVGAAKLAKTLNITKGQAQRFIDLWFRLHPDIKKWQDNIQTQLQINQTICNAFGFCIRFNGRIDQLFTNALAWIPQSTVGIVIDTAMLNMEKYLPDCPLSLQVHDSLVFQVWEKDYPAIIPEIKKQFQILIPYDDPLIIPGHLKVSDKSWGDCEKVEW